MRRSMTASFGGCPHVQEWGGKQECLSFLALFRTVCSATVQLWNRLQETLVCHYHNYIKATITPCCTLSFIAPWDWQDCSAFSSHSVYCCLRSDVVMLCSWKPGIRFGGLISSTNEFLRQFVSSENSSKTYEWTEMVDSGPKILWCSGFRKTFWPLIFQRNQWDSIIKQPAVLYNLVFAYTSIVWV